MINGYLAGLKLHQEYWEKYHRNRNHGWTHVWCLVGWVRSVEIESRHAADMV
jgi:hypothetical protein